MTDDIKALVEEARRRHLDPIEATAARIAKDMEEGWYDDLAQVSEPSFMALLAARLSSEHEARVKAERALSRELAQWVEDAQTDATLRARIAELEEGLKPFAKHFDVLTYALGPTLKDARSVAVIDTHVEGDRYFHELVVRDLCRARALLEQGEG
jgi:hypothetical protein